MTVSELAQHFPVTRPAVSQRLLRLEEVGLVTVEKVGRLRIYRLCPNDVRQLRADVTYFWGAVLKSHARPLLIEAARHHKAPLHRRPGPSSPLGTGS